MNYPSENILLLPIEDKVLFPQLALRLNTFEDNNNNIRNALLDMQHKLESNQSVYLCCFPIKNLSVELNNFASLNKLNQKDLLNQTVCLARLVSLRKSQLLEKGLLLTIQECNKEDLNVHKLLMQKTTELLRLLKEIRLPIQAINRIEQLIKKAKPIEVSDTISVLLGTTFEEKVELLNTHDPGERLKKALEIVIIHIKQKSLMNLFGNNNRNEPESDIDELENKINNKKYPKNVQDIVNKELNRLKRMQSSMADYQVVRTYIEWICDLPWMISSENKIDIEKAKKQLESDHFGLKKVKKRILEYLAVCNLRNDLRAPILCFVGPPGVGKTSIAKSVATSLQRKFYRMSLGGVRDEAEIRGHRRTYVGALPGLIIQGIKKCGENNPVFLLDEIDKIGNSNYHGDPSSALLEVLDPEQNNTFIDHYINIPFDLSNVLFIATANTINTIPEPLLDRMEIIELPGYTIYEKEEIAKKYLIFKQFKAHGLDRNQIQFDNGTIPKIISEYTYEPGVRSLEREIAAVVRFKAVEYITQKDNYNPLISISDIERILGPPKYEDIDDSKIHPTAGVVTGLVYTGSGSGKTMFIECFQFPGAGKLVLTGKLGDVLKESAQLAVSWVKANAFRLGLSDDKSATILDSTDLHLHLPEGATPKDGPSAGVAIVVALISLMTDTLVKKEVAMTGEITLQGLVLPVGGIREKVLAAHRSKIRQIIIPKRNKKDVESEDLPNNVRNDINFVYVSNLYQVLKILFKNMVFIMPPEYSKL